MEYVVGDFGAGGGPADEADEAALNVVAGDDGAGALL